MKLSRPMYLFKKLGWAIRNELDRQNLSDGPLEALAVIRERCPTFDELYYIEQGRCASLKNYIDMFGTTLKKRASWSDNLNEHELNAINISLLKWIENEPDSGLAERLYRACQRIVPLVRSELTAKDITNTTGLPLKYIYKNLPRLESKSGKVLFDEAEVISYLKAHHPLVNTNFF